MTNRYQSEKTFNRRCISGVSFICQPSTGLRNPFLAGLGCAVVCVVWGCWSASGPVSFCQQAGSPASHGRLCVARAVHCQVRPVSSAQLLLVGRSCRNRPATAGVGRAQLPPSAGLTSGPSAIRSRCSCSLLLVSQLLLLAGLRLASRRFAGLHACLPRSVSSPLESLPPPLLPPLASGVGKGPLATSRPSASPPLGPLGRVTSE